MIVKGMPILNVRTLNVDFRTGKLLVKPEGFSSDETDFCYRLTQDSMIYPELAPKEGRFIVCGTGKFLIIGKMVVFKDLYSKFPDLTPKYIRVDNEQNGRWAWGFVGAAFKLDGSDKINVPVIIPDKSLLKIYEQTIADRWFETLGTPGVRDGTSSEMMDIEVEAVEKCTDSELATRFNDIGEGNKIILEDSPENRKKMICFALARALEREKFSCCTSLYTKTAIEKTCFDVVTCRKEDLGYFDKVDDNIETLNISEDEQDANTNFVGRIKKKDKRVNVMLMFLFAFAIFILIKIFL